jgi:hypothetical protein
VRGMEKFCMGEMMLSRWSRRSVPGKGPAKFIASPQNESRASGCRAGLSVISHMSDCHPKEKLGTSLLSPHTLIRQNLQYSWHVLHMHIVYKQPIALEYAALYYQVRSSPHLPSLKDM